MSGDHNMNCSANTGGPAFPTVVRNHYDPETGGQWAEHVDPGMTLRDYFAAKAMQAQLSRPMANNLSDKDQSEYAYQMADAMLKARDAS